MRAAAIEIRDRGGNVVRSADAPASHPSDLAGSVVNRHAPSASFRRGARGPHDPALDASHSYARERAHDASLLRRLVRQHPHLLFGHASLGARRAEEKLAKQREHLDTLLGMATASAGAR